MTAVAQTPEVARPAATITVTHCDRRDSADVRYPFGVAGELLAAQALRYADQAVLRCMAEDQVCRWVAGAASDWARESGPAAQPASRARSGPLRGLVRRMAD